MRILPIVLLAAVTGSASAEKFSHTAEKVKVPELSERTKPPAKSEPAAAKPTMTAQDILDLSTILGPLKDEQEAILLDLIKSSDATDPDLPDYYFRLAELYAKQYQTLSLQATQKVVDADKEKNATRKQKLADEAKELTTKAEAKLTRAAKTYRAMADNDSFKNYPNMDKAMFYFGYTLQKAGRVKDGRDVFDRLLKDYPQSQFVPEAHLAFADYYFEQGQLADAADRYAKVLKFPSSSVYWYAMYMTGWVQLNQKAPADALSTFYKVVQGTEKDKTREALHRASIKDFVRAYAEIGKAEQALNSFKRIDGKGAYDMLEILSDYYIHDGKADKAIYVLRELMHDQPKSNKVCLWEENVAREMMIGASKPEQIHEIEELVKLYSSVGKSLPSADASECHDAAAEMSGQLARAYHQEAVKTMNTELFGLSDKLYRAYLGGFKDAKDWGETGFYHAELLWVRAENERKNQRLQAQLWEDAANAYTDLVQTGKLDPALTKNAADAAMQAWMHAFAVDPRNHAHDNPTADEKYDTIPQPKKISEQDEKLMAAYDVYLKLVKDPKDEELVDVQFQKGRILHKYDHLDEAIKIFDDILTKHKDHDVALFAANLELDSYNLLHRYDDMLALAERLLADKAFIDAHADIKPVLADLQHQYRAKKAREDHDMGLKSKNMEKLVACGNEFLAIYNDAPLAKDAEQALFASGQCYEEGKSLSAAETVFNNVEKLFPDNPDAARAGAHLAAIYSDVAKYEKAAAKLEDYATKYAGETDAFKALSDAVSYRKGIGQDELAIKDTQLFLSKFAGKHPKEAADAAWALAAIYEKQGDLDRLAKSLRTYIDKYATGGGEDRLIAAYARLGDALWKASCNVPTVDGSCARVSRELTGVKVKIASKKKPARKNTCGDDDKIKVTVVDRDAQKVRAAMSAFGSAVAEYEKHQGKTGGDERGAKYYYASAKVGIAERDFEAYMAMPLPTGLDFDETKPAIAKKSHERFDNWVKLKVGAGGKTREQYEAVIKLSDGATAIASAARIGQIDQSFSGQLFRAEIPRNLLDASTDDLDLGQIYCDALQEKADPIEAKAVDAYKFCLDTSTKLGWFSEWSRLCERELGQLDPKDWPTATERRHDPDAYATFIDVEAPAKLTEE